MVTSQKMFGDILEQLFDALGPSEPPLCLQKDMAEQANSCKRGGDDSTLKTSPFFKYIVSVCRYQVNILLLAICLFNSQHNMLQTFATDWQHN